MKKEWKKYLLFFIFILVILYLSPISGDDWGNYLEGSLGLRHVFGNALGMYFDWEGRIVSRIFINFLTYHKYIWNIVNALAITGIVYYMVKIINPKHKKLVFLLSVLTIFLMNIFTFSQVVVWVAGNITYLFVIPLLLYYFSVLLKDQKQSKVQIIIFSFLNLIMTMFVEHMGVVLIFGNILLLINKYLKTKKIDKVYFLYLLFSISGLTSMLLSPGTAKRSVMENPAFNNLSFFSKIGYNIPNFVYYHYIINYFLIALMTIGNYFLLKQLKNKTLKIIGYLTILPFPLFVTLNYLSTELVSISFLTSMETNIFIQIYFIALTVIELILFIKEFSKNKDTKAIFFFLLGLVSNGAMMISPTWGYRTSFASYIFLSLAYILIIDKYLTKEKVLIFLSTGFVIIMTLFYGILYTSVALQNKENLRIIKEQKEKAEKVIEVVKYPYFINCNINPENDYHLARFKEYYDISPDVEIRLVDNNWKYLIFYQPYK